MGPDAPGGEPFEEEIVMWWSFIGRSHEEIEMARKDWMDGTLLRRGPRLRLPRLPAPLPPTALKPRGRVR